MNLRIVLLLSTFLFAGCSASLPEITGPRTGQWREACGVDMNIIAQAVERYRIKTGNFPVRLEMLILGPDNWPDLWEPMLPNTVTLEDPWGFSYRLIIFDPSRAALTGLDFQIISAGPDHQFSTDDDFAHPEPTDLYTPGLSPLGPANRPVE